MRAISPNRQTGVVPHVFSRLEQLAQARSPPKSTQGSASPLLFGQDLVKVSASHFEPGDLRLWQGDQSASPTVAAPHPTLSNQWNSFGAPTNSEPIGSPTVPRRPRWFCSTGV